MVAMNTRTHHDELITDIPDLRAAWEATRPALRQKKKRRPSSEAEPALNLGRPMQPQEETTAKDQSGGAAGEADATAARRRSERHAWPAHTQPFPPIARPIQPSRGQLPCRADQGALRTC